MAVESQTKVIKCMKGNLVCEGGCVREEGDCFVITALKHAPQCNFSSNCAEACLKEWILGTLPCNYK